MTPTKLLERNLQTTGQQGITIARTVARFDEQRWGELVTKNLNILHKSILIPNRIATCEMLSCLS